MSDRYVVVKGRFGMGNRIAVALSAVKYAEATGRELIVDWNDNTYASAHVEDTFSALWDSPCASSVRLEEIQPGSVFPSHWQDRLLDFRNDRNDVIMPYEMAWDRPPAPGDAAAEAADVVVITRDGPRASYADAYSRLVPSELVRRRIEAEAADVDWDRTIGVQIRHGNGERYLTPAATDWFHDRIEAASASGDDASVFLATDSADVVREFTDRYRRLVTVRKWYPTEGSGPMHHHPDCPDRFQSAVDAIVDMWLLARCRHLLICDGGFGRTARNISNLPSSAVEIYPGKIYATVAEKSDWSNPI